MVIKQIEFFKGVTSKGVSEVVKNTSPTQLSLQVSGSAKSRTVVVKGRLNTESGDFVTLPVYDTAYQKTDAITANGIYYVFTDYIRELICEVSAVSGGDVTVYGVLAD